MPIAGKEALSRDVWTIIKTRKFRNCYTTPYDWTQASLLYLTSLVRKTIIKHIDLDPEGYVQVLERASDADTNVRLAVFERLEEYGTSLIFDDSIALINRGAQERDPKIRKAFFDLIFNTTVQDLPSLLTVLKLNSFSRAWK